MRLLLSYVTYGGASFFCFKLVFSILHVGCPENTEKGAIGILPLCVRDLICYLCWIKFLNLVVARVRAVVVQGPL